MAAPCLILNVRNVIVMLSCELLQYGGMGEVFCEWRIGVYGKPILDVVFHLVVRRVNIKLKEINWIAVNRNRNGVGGRR